MVEDEELGSGGIKVDEGEGSETVLAATMTGWGQLSPDSYIMCRSEPAFVVVLCKVNGDLPANASRSSYHEGDLLWSLHC